jgi:uncharacterized protein
MTAALHPSIPASAGRPFHVMTKPIGPICNLDCSYCFYLEKEELYPDTRKWAMPENVLEKYVREYIEHQNVPEISFAWQGGEPTLLGVGYFRRVVELQKRYANGKTIHNAFQTNGTLLDDEWGKFLAESGFLVGLSVDGPRELHDRYRVDKQRGGTFDAVMRGLEVLKRNHVEFNTLTVVNRANGDRALDVYRFLKGIGSSFLQFIPLVERSDSHNGAGVSLTVGGRPVPLAAPPMPHRPGMFNPGSEAPADDLGSVTDWSVAARQYGNFLCTIFDEWVQRDVGRVFVQLFDVTLGKWMGQPSGLCVFAETCGSALAIEHNGDVYSCDHYVYPQYRLGNVMNELLGDLVRSEQQVQFGRDKATSLPAYCRSCSVRSHCNGECPKHRFINTPDGEAGLNYLCAAYKRFFSHTEPAMKTMAGYLRAGQPPALIMRDLARTAADPRSAPGRNGPCPCGSGRKFKKCCGAT